MAKQLKRRRSTKGTTSRRRRPGRKPKRSFFRRKRQPQISDARLERGLRVLSATNDIAAAARSIHVSIERFKRAARTKNAIRKVKGQWTVARRFSRQIPIFSDGKLLSLTVSSKSAKFAGEFMFAAGQFFKTNDPQHLAGFKGRGVKDTSGKFHEFETDPNTLYRLSSAGGEPFEEFYRIIL
jgi:hypothetical protein